MAYAHEIEGFAEVVNNLNREIQNIKGRCMQGLIEVAIDIYRDMDKKAPKIPVDLGNLRASFFIVTSRGRLIQENKGFKGEKAGELQTQVEEAIGEAKAALSGNTVLENAGLIMGFGANYALFVHEMVESKKGEAINWNRPGSGAKFFESHFKENAGKALQTIAKHAKIK